MNISTKSISYFYFTTRRVGNFNYYLPRCCYFYTNGVVENRVASALKATANDVSPYLLRKRFYGTKPAADTRKGDGSDESKSDESLVAAEKLGLIARFKLMYKQYWYVLIPVHVMTSIGWLGGFYYLSKSGVDIPSVLQALHVSESVIDKLKDSDMGHLAIAYLCYKIATPARYMVTLGGTTISIKYLEQAGYIKPMPTKSQLIQMYEDKKADFAKRRQEKAEQTSKDDK